MTTSGYTGGTKVNPTYEQVSAGGTGHAESVQVVYDPTQVSPTRSCSTCSGTTSIRSMPSGQFCDKGQQYRTAIFFTATSSEARWPRPRRRRLSSRRKLPRQPIVDRDRAGHAFYPAEDYHQDYYMKNPAQYKFYRWNCGRDDRLEPALGRGRRRTEVIVGRPVRLRPSTRGKPPALCSEGSSTAQTCNGPLLDMQVPPNRLLLPRRARRGPGGRAGTGRLAVPIDDGARDEVASKPSVRWISRLPPAGRS